MAFASPVGHDKPVQMFADFSSKHGPTTKAEILASVTTGKTSVSTPTTPAGGPPTGDLLPDIFPWADQANGFMYGGFLDTTTISGRTLYRFATAVPNIGHGPMELRGGTTLPSGNQEVFQRIFLAEGGFRDELAGEFTFHPTHGHIHFDGYANFSLREVLPGDGVGNVVGIGAKVSFCLIDVAEYDLGLPNADPNGAYTGCGQVQGVSVGWADVYEANLDDQWVDVTGLPAGQYWLENVVDPNNRLLESDETNNTTRILIDLATTPGTGDRFEVNDSFATATNLGFMGDRTEAALTLHTAGDTDFFRMRAAADGMLNIDVAFQHALGDVDIILYDAAQNEIARSEGTADLEHISTSVTQNSVYYLQVLGHDNATSPNYRVVIDGPDTGDITQTVSSTEVPVLIADPPPGGPVTIIESTLEGPDLVLTDLNLILDSLPHTWLGNLHVELTSPRGTTVVVIVSEPFGGILAGARAPDGSGPNDFLGTILDDQAATNLAAGTAPYTGSFNVNHPTVGLNPLALFNGQNALGTWTLRIVDLVPVDAGTLEGWSIRFTGTTTPPAGDRFEPNDGFGAATALGALGNRTETDLSIHLPNNEDFYRFTAAATGNLVANVLFIHAQGNIDAALYDANQNLLTFSASLDDDEQITWGVTAGETYYLRVVVFNADVNPDYDLVINGPDPTTGKTSVTMASSDVPKAIPDNFPPGVTSTLVGPNLVLNDVNLMIDDLRHTWLGDLHIELTSPAGTTAVLVWGEIEGPPGILLGTNGPDDFIGTVFDDEAALNLRQGIAPYSGRFNVEYSTVAQSPLSVFEGENAAGVWTLRIADTVSTDEGVLNNWSLEFRGLPPSSENAQISGVKFHDRDGDGVRGENEPGLAGWAIFLDTDNDGARDVGDQTLSFGNEMIMPLPDVATSISTLAVTGVEGTLADVNVSVAIAHTWDADLDVFLISPDGTRVELFTDVGGDVANDHFYYTSLDDRAITPIALGAAPFAGPFAPETPLAVLNGENPNGTWTLEITDDEQLDTGTLVGWWLTLSTDAIEDPIAITDADGQYSFSNVPDGDYTVVEVNQPNWIQTSPAAPGTHAITVAGDTHTGVDFGNQRQTIHLGGVSYRDQNGNQIQDPTESPLAGWTIYLDDDDDGIFDMRAVVVNPPEASLDVPKNIVDLGTITSTLQVADLAEDILDVDVTVTLTHTWDEDLDLALISPAGTRVDLSSDNGLDRDNYTGTIFDDEASTSISNGFAPFAGRFRPEVPLSNLDHQDPNGAWSLEVRDDFRDDVGVLLSWSITVTTQGKGEASVVTDSQGQYLFENLAPGQYFIREVDQPDWVQVAPAAGKHDVTLGPGDEALDLDFGNQSQLVTLAGRVYDDQNGDGDGDGDPSLAGWVVYRDLNLNGTRDVNPSVTQDFPSTDVPLPINDFVTQTSVISVSGLPETVADVNVSLSGTHTFDADLDVFLISPSGTRVELFTDVGVGGLNFNPTLDDEAAAAITTAAPPFDGTFRPEGLLSAFDGEAGNGVWTLEITDDESEDVGNLVAWSLAITTIGTSEPFVVTGSDGRYEFDFLPPGEYTLREEVQATYTQTAPAGGAYTVTLSPAEQSLDLDFGNSRCLHDRDLDNDLDVDRDDLLLLFAKFGQSATPDEGDIDCNGTVTLADVAELQANLTPPPAPSAPAAVVVRARAAIQPAAADRAHAELPGGITRRLAAIRRTPDVPQRQTTASQRLTPGPTTHQPGAMASDEAISGSLRARRRIHQVGDAIPKSTIPDLF